MGKRKKGQGQGQTPESAFDRWWPKARETFLGLDDSRRFAATETLEKEQPRARKPKAKRKKKEEAA